MRSYLVRSSHHRHLMSTWTRSTKFFWISTEPHWFGSSISHSPHDSIPRQWTHSSSQRLKKISEDGSIQDGDSFSALLNESIAEQKENERGRMDHLLSQTQTLLSRFSQDDDTLQPVDNPRPSNDQLQLSCISLIHDWFQLQTDVEEKNISSCSSGEPATMMRRRRSIPPIPSPQHTLIICAQHIHTLLQYYILLLKKDHLQGSFQDKSQPFQIAMKAWNRTCSRHSKFCYPLSGQYCASILDEWGSLYGGDLIHAPTVQAFNLCLETLAYASSGPYTETHESHASTKDINSTSPQYLVHDSDTFAFPAVQAWDIFQILNQDFVLRPTLETYCHVITAWTHHTFAIQHSRNIQAYKKAMDDENQRPLFYMNSYTTASLAFQTFTQLLECLISSKKQIQEKHPTISQQQEHELLLLEAFTNILALISRGYLMEDTVHTMDKSKPMTPPEQAELVLHRLLLLMRDPTFFPPRDKAISYSRFQYLGDAYLSCMIAWTLKRNEQSSVHEKIQSAQSIMKLFHELHEKALEDKNDTLPNSSHFYSVVNAYACCLDNAQQWTQDDKKQISELQIHRVCWKMLEKLEELDYSHKLNENNKWDIQLIYCRVIWILSQSLTLALCSKDPMTVAINAETALTTLTHKYQSGSLRVHNPQDITRAFNHVMLLHSHPSLHKLTEDKVSSSFIQLVALSQSSNHKAPKPDAVSYSLYMTHLSRSPNEDSVQKILTLLTDMERQYENGTGLVRPNMIHYSTAIKLLGKVKKNSTALMDLFHRAEVLVNESEKEITDDPHFNPVILHSSYISALSDSGYPTCGIEALKCLRKLKERYHGTRDDKFQPDVIMFSVVLHAISKSKVVDRALVSEAEAILDEIETLHRNGKGVIPNRTTYTSMMKIWTKAGLQNTSEKCLETIERMMMLYNETGNEDIFPDIVAYSVALDAISQNVNSGSVEKALALLNEMEERSKNGSILKPNAIAYTKVIKTILKSNSPDVGNMAEKVLDKMEERCRDGDFSTNPDCYTYTFVIQCWGRSQQLDKVTRAWNVLLRMKKKYEEGNLAAMPNVVTFTSLINCCAHAPDDEGARDEALLVAVKAFKLLQSTPHFGTANSTTYRTLLEVFGRNVKNAKVRSNHSSKIFQHCSDGGMVDDAVLKTLQRYTNDLYKQLPSTLPKSWSRNVS